MNWINAILDELFHGEPNAPLVIILFLIMSFIVYYSPSVEGI